MVAAAPLPAGKPMTCPTCHGKGYDPEARVGHLNANPTTPESIEAINSVLDAVLRRFAPCPDCAPLLACGHPDTTPEVHHDHEGQPSCVDCCDKCSPGQGT